MADNKLRSILATYAFKNAQSVVDDTVFLLYGGEQ